MAGKRTKTAIGLWRRYQKMAHRRQEDAKRLARSVAGRYLVTKAEPRPLWPWLLAGVGTGAGLSLAATLGSRRAMLKRQASAPEVSRTTVVDGILMRWEEQGEGAPVVLVHGIPTNPRLWRFVLPRLEGLKALAWEMVGFGWSIPAGFGRDISLRAQSVYLYRWLQTMGIERAVFVGHDLGGGVVQRFAVEHPEMCAGLVLVDSVAYDNWPVAPIKAARASRNAIAKMPNPLVRPLVTSAVATLGHDSVQGRAEAPNLYWSPYAATRAGEALAHQLASLDPRHTMEIADDLASLSVPARIVWGELDPLGMHHARRLARDLRAPIRAVPMARHFTPEDHADEVADEINDLVRASGYVRGHPPAPEVEERT